MARTACMAIAFMMAMVGPAIAGERILALAPHVCEILYAIHAEDHLVGAVDYCDYPEAAKRLPVVGTYRGVDVEAALRLRPTLAIAMARNLPGIAQLEAHGVRILVSGPQTLDEVLADIVRIGRVCSHLRDAEVLVAPWRKLLDSPPLPSVRAFYEIWPKPLITAGRRTFITDLLWRAGFANIFADLDLEAPRVGEEAVLRRRPQVVLVPTEKRDMEARRRFWHALLGPDVHVLAVPHDLMHRPGPRVFEGLQLLRQLRAEIPQ